MPYFKEMARSMVCVSQTRLRIIAKKILKFSVKAGHVTLVQRKKKGDTEGEPSESPAHPIPRHRWLRCSICRTSDFEYVENAVVIVVSIFVVV